MQQLNKFLVLVIVLLTFFQYRSCQTKQDVMSVLQNKTGQLVKTRNSYNQEVSRRAVLMGSISELKKTVDKKDSLIKHLLNRLTQTTISLTAIKTQTQSNHTTPTTVVLHDTVKVDSIITIYPEYSSNYENQWEKYTIKATKDSVYHTHSIHNLFDVEQKYVSQGLLKPQAIQVEIVNHNPSTITVDAQSFLIHPKKENRLLWLTGCFLAGWIGNSVLHR